MPRNQSKREEHLQTVVELAKSGHSLSEISRELSGAVSIPTISRWLSAEGVQTARAAGMKKAGGKGRHPSREEAEAAMAQGEGPVEVAQRMGLPKETVHRWRQESGLCRCGKPAQDGFETYCSSECRETYSKRRADPSKQVTFNCEHCGEEVTRWKGYGGGANKFCSNACARRWTRTTRHIGVKDTDVVLDSTWEALAYGLLGFLKIPVERTDREQGVEWTEGNWYAPDFYLPRLGLWIEIKGQEDPEDQERWRAFREQVGRLAVVDQDALEAIRSLDRAGVETYLGWLAPRAQI